MPTTAPVPPSQYGLKDLEFEISDAAWEHSEQYWAPIEHIANRYLAFHEATSRIAAGLRTLASVDQDRQEGEFYDIASELAEVDELDVDRWLRAEVKLEDRHEARRDLIVEWIARYVTDRFLEKHARLRTARSVAEVFEWIGLSIATGVSGNLAYDTLKKGWGFGWRGVFRRLRRFPNPSRVDPDEAILYLIRN